MDPSRILLLIFVVMTPSECSGKAEPKCEDFDTETYILLEGEAFYYEPYALPSANCSDEEFTWYKNGSQVEYITTDKSEIVHYRGGALFFLDLHSEHSGFYTGRQIKPSGECFRHHVKIDVLKSGMDEPLYGEIKNSDLNKKIPCPTPVSYTCDLLEGRLTWMKDHELIQGEHEADLRVFNATRDDEGIYTCICTWTYNHKAYKSSGSRRLRIEDPKSHRTPIIISPTYKELTADEGFRIQLNCSVFCGTNVKQDCCASWHINGVPFTPKDGYNQTTKRVIEIPSYNTISTAILTIEKVSAKDFQTEFKCIGVGLYRTVSHTSTLKRRESIIPLVIGLVFVLFFFVVAAVLVKCFAIDLALFFRRCLPLRTKDPRIYDAYVVYEMQGMDKVTEDTLCQFITKNLPSVLEEKCGYRLFIHGRDDIPGEDRLELVEDRIKQSRRLMVILNPGSGSASEITDQHLASPQNSAMGGFDWQVGLHHALVQREMSVILIQLGDTGPEGYTHLPPGLQHLIQKSAPIRWPEGSQGAAAWNSRFWKRVRYLMPAIPAKKCPQSAII